LETQPLCSEVTSPPAEEGEDVGEEEPEEEGEEGGGEVGEDERGEEDDLLGDLADTTTADGFA
jgi:hypothetical protein